MYGFFLKGLFLLTNFLLVAHFDGLVEAYDKKQYKLKSLDSN